jgi:hypothetical protein
MDGKLEFGTDAQRHTVATKRMKPLRNNTDGTGDHYASEILRQRRTSTTQSHLVNLMEVECRMVVTRGCREQDWREGLRGDLSMSTKLQGNVRCFDE